MYILKNRYLEVHIDESYKRVRFDHLGMITKIIYIDKHTMTGVESLLGQGSGGMGLFNEFGIDEAIGYENDDFLKIGVGALKKVSNEDYDFFFDYPADLFEYSVEENQTSISFTQTCPHINGYAVRYIKEISLQDQEIIVRYYLKNIGRQPISTSEYCHNFITINDNIIGPDYELRFSYPIQVESGLGEYDLNDTSLSWQQTLKEVMYITLKDLPKESNQYFEICHIPSGLTVRESHDFPLHKVAIWAMPHVVSPEAFIKIDLQADEEKTWTRKYTFYKR